jgi:hypothetical protein
MAVELQIQDGNPWWMSPDIWTVPGNDPEGAPGTPIVGQPTYLWARVTNTGRSSVTNATVRYYWANPSVGFDRNTANPIGTSNVNLAAGESAEVLCLTPWIPEYVNEGHECVLAEAFHPSLDPLPATAAFDVPTDRHVAQRNLSVVLALQGFFSFSFVIYNTQRIERRFQIRAYQGEMGDLKPLQRTMGLERLPENGKIARIAFADERCPDEKAFEKATNEKMELSIPGKGSRFLTLIGRIEGEGALVHVEQVSENRQIGGLSVLVRGDQKTDKSY